MCVVSRIYLFILFSSKSRFAFRSFVSRSKKMGASATLPRNMDSKLTNVGRILITCTFKRYFLSFRVTMVRLWWIVLLLMICGVLADKGRKSGPDEKNNPGDKQSLEEKPNQMQTIKEEEKVQPNIIFVLVRQSLIATGRIC